jgi:hypothetical protein
MNKFDRCAYTAALHACGAICAAWLITCNIIGRTAYRLRYGNFDKQTIRAIRKANDLAQATGYTYYVLNSKGRVVIKPKRLIKNLIACRGKYFKRGTTIQDIERIALYIAVKH